MGRRSIDEIVVDCLERGPDSFEFLVEHIRSEHPEISDREITAIINGAIERLVKHDQAILTEYKAQHPEEALTAEKLSVIVPNLLELVVFAIKAHCEDTGETGTPR